MASVILSVSTNAAAASVLTVNQTQSSLIAIDPQTGATTAVATLPALGIAGGTSTFDAVGGRLFYVGSDGTNAYLVTVNVASGTVTQVPLSNPALFAEYDPATGAVLVQSGTTLRAVDPATGNGAIIAMLPPLGIAGGTSTFDAEGRRLFYIAGDGSNSFLVTVNVSSGTVTQVPISNPTLFAEYDAVTGAVFVDSGTTLRAVDPATGNGAVVAMLPPSIAGGTSTFDVVGRRLFYFGSDGTNIVLITVFVATGTTSHMTVPSAGLFTEFAASAAAVPAVGMYALLFAASALGVLGVLRAAQ